MFVVPKEARRLATASKLVQAAGGSAPGGGKMEGRPIDTIGYRGMHSYEDRPRGLVRAAENLIGIEGGQARSFYCRWPG
ncbi:MAG: hypothetical protein R2746_04520 [Acidimicrobiales bacterium]